MNNKFKWISIIANVILVLIIIFSIQRCNSLRKENNANIEAAKLMYNDSISKYQLMITKAGDTIAYQRQFLVSKDLAIGTLISEKEMKEKEIKKLKAQYKASEIISVKNDTVPFLDTIEHIVYIDTNTNENRFYVELPIRFGQTLEWYSITGTIYESGVFFEDISFLSEPKFTVGTKGKGLKGLFNPTPVVYYENMSPYAKTIGMQNFEVKYSQKFYQKPWFIFFSGFVGGFGASTGVHMLTK